ncbi:hypothetical protein HY573_01715 [Candidatus Parcubacteria bacterium]|nr:hypothetical protein [Candidatus Parcubacteria bacterium]
MKKFIFVAGVFGATALPFLVAAQAIPTLTVSLDSSASLVQTVAAGQTNVAFAAVRVVGGATPVSINGIKVASDSPNASRNVYNIKVYDGADLVASTFLSSFPDFEAAFDGGQYYTWFNLSSPIILPANGTKIFNIVANILPQGSGAVRLGIAGLNSVPPVAGYLTGAQISGLPVYGQLMTIQATTPQPSTRYITVLSPSAGEVVYRGGPYRIRWSAPVAVGDDWSVALYLWQNGTVLGRISAAGITASIGEYAWDTDQYFLEATGASVATVAGGNYQIEAVLQQQGKFAASTASLSFNIVDQGSRPDDLSVALQRALIREGDLVRARGDYKVWIVKGGYRRHITSAKIFSFYGHLGFDRVGETDPAILGTFVESRLVRAVGDDRVYQIDVAGRKRWLKMSAEQFYAAGFSPGEIYDINVRERDFYRTGANLTPGDFTQVGR